MQTNIPFWKWRKYAGRFAWALAVGGLAVFAADSAFAQREGGGKGGGGGVGGGGGGGAVRAQSGGGGGAAVRAQGGGQAGGAVRAQGQGSGGARVSGGAGGGAAVRTPAASGGAAVRTPAASGGAAVRTPAASGGATFRGPTASGGAAVRTPPANAGAAVRTPGANIDAGVRTPPANIDAAARAPAVSGRANINPPAARAGANIDTPAARAGATVRTPAASGSATVRGPTASGAIDAQGATPNLNIGASGRASAGAEPRTALRPNIDAAAGSRAATNFRTNWNNLTPAQRQAFRTTFGGAVNAQAAADRAAMNNWLGANPTRAAYWSNWGGNVRNNFVVGPSPYFNSGFWGGGRSLVGLGLGSGFTVGGFGPGYAPGMNWWGYSPWVGSQPWNYWYGNPGWNTFAGSYGWRSPYFYDYGPNGNVVYTSNRVLVNNQPVGTPADYAQSAADLAMVSEAQMNAEHDWIPLGTFSVATSQDETNPARVIQLAHDNKQGLISGTIFNKASGNLYTVQGRVDPDTQRVAFTIGKDPNVVMETGLFNLTQNETPVLVHFGPSKTATYLFARLPEPQQSAEAAAATATAPPPAPPADDFRRE